MDKSVIYQTKNLYNEKNNINPYLYIGSQQKFSDNYFGSNKQLINDIKKLGEKWFEKTILCEFHFNIENTLLRKIESDIQKFIDVAKNPVYYNRTNTALKGYIETIEEKNLRMSKTKTKRDIWWNSLSEDERKNVNKNGTEKLIKISKNNKGKTYEDIYGLEAGKAKREKCYGKNNGQSKQVLELSTGIIFNTIEEIKLHLGVKKHSTIVNMSNRGDRVKIL